MRNTPFPPFAVSFFPHPLPHAHDFVPPDLRDANDALIVFEAVRMGVLPLIKRRLTSDERDQLGSGNVFVWEEAEHKQGAPSLDDGAFELTKAFKVAWNAGQMDDDGVYPPMTD